ncbi:hypothetical protein SNE40_001845 [Patella caerulea]|uniref:Uncharacterized protein n=1 Tax=Patella caerulea TaxID=87958 RepID=A0AAN8KB70_PATCE
MMSIILCALVLVAAATSGASGHCAKPPNFRARERSVQHIPVKDVPQNISIPQRYNNTVRFFLGSSDCPQDDITSTDFWINKCPVHYVGNVDDNRIPKMVLEKRCSCTTPVTSDGSVSVYDCITISTPRTVYRRTGCKNGIYEYSLTREYFDTQCVKHRNVRHVAGSPKSAANPSGHLHHAASGAPKMPR